MYVFLQGKGVLKFDPKTKAYKESVPLPEVEWFAFDCVATGSSIYLFGGS